MLDYLATKLNDEQLAAATHISTSSLILAGAGSGKTRVLTYKIAYLIFGHHIPVSRILAVTFTNKAANEMKERLIHLSQEWNEEMKQNWQNAVPLSAHDFRRIGTFHAIFLKILKEDIDQTNFGYSKSFVVYDSDEAMSVIKNIMKDDKSDKMLTPREVKWAISKLKNEGIDYQTYYKHAESQSDYIVAKVYEKYQTQLQISNALDFDDLLLYPYLMFRQYPALLSKWQKRFDYILVDEAQDTNWIQFELMKQLSKSNEEWSNKNITLIGDDFQSIYGRRGALMENFLTVHQIRSDIQMFKLQTNYRSRPHIVHAGSHIIKHNTRQYEKTIIPHRAGDDKIVIFNHADESAEAMNIVDFLTKLKAQNHLSRNDFAILYRTNAQSSPFEQVLIKEAIPYKIFGGFRFFDRKEVKDIVSYLRYILNPRDNVALKRIINIPSRKLGDTTIKKIEDTALLQEVSLHEVLLAIDSIASQFNKPTIDKLKEFTVTINELSSQLTEMTPGMFIKWLLLKIQYAKHILAEEWNNQQSADERMGNIGQLINMAEKYEWVWPEALTQMMDEISLLTDAAASNDEETESIKLMTVHASKWLEFPYVFVVGMEENVFPLGNARLELKLLEEERRLAYVAITRAQDHLFLSYADSRMQRWQTNYNKVSRFIEEIPDELKKAYSFAEAGRQDLRERFDEWDTVKHKLFGEGTILEIRGDLAIVKFSNPTFATRKVPLRLVEKK